ncbi:hypothetical protein TOPH_07354 [Tolypocladium ophioglossoides CBS 100239]|uniref:CCD97-like C-terminal domain-containing protein n=1 Tax=Tolypocladium ophioglossoides (strain CBS 100239) TaxID=1163406 RepID=A0A0L0N1I1_TOLOC|nr:hypothetical protein TOPH_07354 [Tolypocladium ophioglossoides CBS 100239]KND87943.1 hypothetical protein TOPH_07354 [Tolypocladium ophioglossoides CBS 100239]
MAEMDVDALPGDGFEKPVPRQPKSPTKAAQIQAQNRRREWLERNPSYFESLEHELADPILYERLVKRLQTAAERQDEGKAKGFGRTLEADLARGEQRLSSLDSNGADDGHAPGLPAEGIDDPWDSAASGKEHGGELWHEFLKERFIRGGDDEFDYEEVDDNEELDVLARREAEDEWFEDEEPSWAAEGDADVRVRQGETGVQDF